MRCKYENLYFSELKSFLTLELELQDTNSQFWEKKGKNFKMKILNCEI